MSQHAKEPWVQGATLPTAQTKRWSKEQWDENDARERCLIFAGGQPVAQCKRPEDASRIVAAVNACKGIGQAGLSAMDDTGILGLAIEANHKLNPQRDALLNAAEFFKGLIEGLSESERAAAGLYSIHGWDEHSAAIVNARGAA